MEAQKHGFRPWIPTLSKYIHVWSCFEEFLARNTMVQSDFNYDTWFRCYDFFIFQNEIASGDINGVSGLMTSPEVRVTSLLGNPRF